MVVEFIDAHRVRFGVQPICRVLTEHGCKIAPSTYYAAKSRAASARSISDGALLVEIKRVHSDPNIGRGLHGVAKVWHQLRRENIVPARCTIERLMRLAGLQGVRRGKQFVTTKSDPSAVRPPDLVERTFTAERPNRLWVADIERHEALLNRAVVKGHRPRLVAASREKLRAA